MNMILSFQQVMWCDVMWRAWRVWREKPQQKRPEWTILNAIGPQNNNHPQEWEDNIVIEK